MSFVSLGGDGSTRPTFFEMVAADRLMASLKAATMYSLSVPPLPHPSPEHSASQGCSQPRQNTRRPVGIGRRARTSCAYGMAPRRSQRHATRLRWPRC